MKIPSHSVGSTYQPACLGDYPSFSIAVSEHLLCKTTNSSKIGFTGWLVSLYTWDQSCVWGQVLEEDGRGCHVVRKRRGLEMQESFSPEKARLQRNRKVYLNCIVITAVNITEREGKKSLSSKLVSKPFTVFRSTLPS